MPTWVPNHLPACLGTSTTYLMGSAISLGGLGGLHLAECLTACLPAWEEPKLLLGGASLASWEAVLSPACLPAWEGTKLLPSWERISWEGELLGGTALPSWEVALSLACL